MRFRYKFIFGGAILTLIALLSTNPDYGFIYALPFGADEITWALRISRGLVVLAFVYWATKAWNDYPEGDTQAMLQKAKETPEGAGRALIYKGIIFFGLVYLFVGVVNAQEVPKQALPYLPVLKAEQVKYWPQHPAPEQLGGLVDHESACPRVRSCWSPAAQLKTKREEGAGFGQITRAYRKDGGLRFDALAEMRSAHPALGGWSWSNAYQRPDYQLRAVVLKSLDNFKALRMVADPMERLNFADAGYNGGMGGVQNERRACGLSAGCNPQRWFNHVELHCLKSRSALYGQRSACDINRHHVRDVVLVRSAKYKRWLA
jgi:hypothetical protein